MSDQEELESDLVEKSKKKNKKKDTEELTQTHSRERLEYLKMQMTITLGKNNIELRQFREHESNACQQQEKDSCQKKEQRRERSRLRKKRWLSYAGPTQQLDWSLKKIQPKGAR